MTLEKVLGSRLARNLRDAAGTVRAALFLGSVMISGATLLVVAASQFFARPLVAALLAGLFMILIAVSTYAWYFVTRVYDPTFYEILEVEGLLVVEPVESHHRYTYVRKQTIRATRNNLRLVEFRARWTGAGRRDPRVKSAVQDHVLLDGSTREEGAYVYRWVYPGRPLDKGQTATLGVEQTHEDNVQQQQIGRAHV